MNAAVQRWLTFMRHQSYYPGSANLSNGRVLSFSRSSSLGLNSKTSADRYPKQSNTSSISTVCDTVTSLHLCSHVLWTIISPRPHKPEKHIGVLVSELSRPTEFRHHATTSTIVLEHKDTERQRMAPSDRPMPDTLHKKPTTVTPAHRHRSHTCRRRAIHR